MFANIKNRLIFDLLNETKMTRYELLPVKQKGNKTEGYFIFDNQLKTYWKDHAGINYYTTQKNIAVEIVHILNTQNIAA